MLRPDFHPEIPEETVKVARAAFPNRNMYLSLRDTLGAIFEDETFQDLYPALGQPAESLGRLALVTVMQYVENLSDRQAAEAVRSRIDWKYMLGLSLEASHSLRDLPSRIENIRESGAIPKDLDPTILLLWENDRFA